MAAPPLTDPARAGLRYGRDPVREQVAERVNDLQGERGEGVGWVGAGEGTGSSMNHPATEQRSSELHDKAPDRAGRGLLSRLRLPARSREHPNGSRENGHRRRPIDQHPGRSSQHHRKQQRQERAGSGVLFGRKRRPLLDRWFGYAHRYLGFHSTWDFRGSGPRLFAAVEDRARNAMRPTPLISTENRKVCGQYWKFQTANLWYKKAPTPEGQRASSNG